MRARQAIEEIVRGAIAAADPVRAVGRAIEIAEPGLLAIGGSRLELPSSGRLLVLGAGKAAAGMAEATIHRLGDRLSAGAITVPHGTPAVLPPLDVWHAAHPVPDVGGLAGAAEALALARSAGPADLLICLLSGGASALWPAPPAGVTLEELREITSTLLSSGAEIAAVNLVRRHLTRIGGGRLARAASPAAVLTLAVSDVVGAGPEAIGSGPTVPEPGSYAEALSVLDHLRIRRPTAVVNHLQAGAAREKEAKIPPGGAPSPLSEFHLVASIDDALRGAAAAAERLGFRAEVLPRRLSGEARLEGAALASEALFARRAGGGPQAFVWGGETTVLVRGKGRGGRNQELALAAARAIRGERGITIAAFGTDGVDGPTAAAGACVDGDTLARARSRGFDAESALTTNDAYPFLEAAGDLLITGPTGTNVGDLAVVLVQ